MNRINPLVTDALRGLARPSAPEMAYLNCMLLQGLVLVLWWPKRELFQALLRESGPDTLFAVVAVFGFTLAYWSIRAGAEELLPDAHRSLREWALGSPLGYRRIVVGYGVGHCLQSLWWLVLSAPLLAVAFSVGGGDGVALGWSLAVALVQGLVFRLLGACLYLRVGHLGTLMFLGTRALIAVSYVGAALALPVVSHLVIAYRLFERCLAPACTIASATWSTGLAERVGLDLTGPIGAAVVAILLLTSIVVALALLLAAQLRSERIRAEGALNQA